MKRTFLFATIASILSINAYAVSATVTSKDYVDTTRQATIPAAETNYDTPGVSVVTYTDTAGTIGERHICDARADGNKDCSPDDLVTRDTLGDQIIFLGDQIEQATNLPTITTSKMTCVDSPDCTLWSVADRTVYGACKAYGETVSDASECCSGVFNGDSTNCGCSSDDDCTDPDSRVCNTLRHYCGAGGPK